MAACSRTTSIPSNTMTQKTAKNCASDWSNTRCNFDAMSQWLAQGTAQGARDQTAPGYREVPVLARCAHESGTPPDWRALGTTPAARQQKASVYGVPASASRTTRISAILEILTPKPSLDRPKPAPHTREPFTTERPLCHR